MGQITKRLLPGQDLREEIEKIVVQNKIQAGGLLSLVVVFGYNELIVS